MRIQTPKSDDWNEEEGGKLQPHHNGKIDVISILHDLLFFDAEIPSEAGHDTPWDRQHCDRHPVTHHLAEGVISSEQRAYLSSATVSVVCFREPL